MYSSRRRFVALLAVAAVFLLSALPVYSTAAVPTPPPLEYHTPSNGATITTAPYKGVVVEFACPRYEQYFEESPSRPINWASYRVKFATSPELNPAGELATPFVIQSSLASPTNAAEDQCKAELSFTYAEKPGTYYWQVSRPRGVETATSGIEEQGPVWGFTMSAPSINPTLPTTPTTPTTPNKPKTVNITTYTACGLNRRAPKSNRCTLGHPFGTFFKASQNTRYTVCVRFPTSQQQCARKQFAEAGTLYVNEVKRVDIVGRYEIKWIVEGHVFRRVVHLVAAD